MIERRDLISRCAPPGDLAPLVEAFAGRTANVQRARFPVFPTARAELIFHFGDPFQVADESDGAMRALAPAVLLGPRGSISWQSAGPRIDWFLVQLTPLGCRCVLGASFGESWHREIALSDLWGSDALVLHDKLAEIPSFEARRALVLAEIRARCGVVDADPLTRVGSLVRTGQIRHLDQLGLCLDVGPRRLHQRFVARYGVGPKTLLSLLRFGRQLEARHPLSMIDAEPEYADESHAIREFRRFTGLTPGAYARQKRHDRLVYTGTQVLLD